MIQENYTPGHSLNASQFMAKRRASNHAAFFLPYLKPGMKTLDCGCGPGTITVGLAEAVAPAPVIGVDFAESQIALARATAERSGISNVQFKVSSTYHLPFDDGEFDAIFSHALLEHLSEPLKAVCEMKRVLKVDGVLGVCSPDWGGFLIAPSIPDLEAAIEFYKRLQVLNGGDVYIGRQLKAILREAGFTHVKASGSYECYEDPRFIAEYLALRIEASASSGEAARLGEQDTAKIGAMAQALRAWSEHPDALFAQAWLAAVGWGEGPRES